MLVVENIFSNFPEEQFVVHLSWIVAVTQQKYILDNAYMVV